jgi:co-chaperonin GroES (HSP10)
MKIFPKNKHLLVELIEEEAQEKSSVLLPADYQKKQDSVLARVVRVHESVQGEISEGSMVVAEPNMIREVSFGGSTYYLLQANYVLCEVKE